MSRLRFRFAVVIAFSIAMAWMESATVVYLRTLLNRVEPYQSEPLPIAGTFGVTEVVREAATLIMLIAVSILAGASRKSRLGFFMTAFGVWDLFYYLFLKIIAGWPHSFLDWDILFLIPLPWWGPVLSPVLISVILIALGILLARDRLTGATSRISRVAWTFHACGVCAALYVFMAHSVQLLLRRSSSAEELPSHFSWPIFGLALIFMMMPVLEAVIRYGKEIRGPINEHTGSCRLRMGRTEGERG